MGLAEVWLELRHFWGFSREPFAPCIWNLPLYWILVDFPLLALITLVPYFPLIVMCFICDTFSSLLPHLVCMFQWDLLHLSFQTSCPCGMMSQVSSPLPEWKLIHSVPRREIDIPFGKQYLLVLGVLCHLGLVSNCRCDREWIEP